MSGWRDEPAGQRWALRVSGQAEWTVRLGWGEVLDPDGGREKPREVATMSKVYVFQKAPPAAVGGGSGSCDCASEGGLGWGAEPWAWGGFWRWQMCWAS